MSELNKEETPLMYNDVVVNPLLVDQWEKWIAENPPDQVEDISDEQMREIIIADLSKVSKMSVGEYTLYQKWRDLRFKYPGKVKKGLFGKEFILDQPNKQSYINKSKNNIWYPESIDDYMNLKPKMILSDNYQDFELKLKGSEIWNTIRNFITTQKNNSNIGRNLNYLVVDDVTGKYLGVICISSDFMDLTPRDNWIGWDRDIKTSQAMINYTAIGSTIVPTQPMGYNYVGGKLLALLCLEDTVQKDWKERYGDVLVGVTTTSLYGKAKTGGLSQYDRLKHWKKMGYTSGSVAFETERETRDLIRRWLHKHHTYRYFEWYGATKPDGKPFKRDHRNRSFHFTYNKLGIDKDLISCAHGRGVYFSPLYENTKEFLTKQIKEDKLVKMFDTSNEYLVNLWKTKYAKKRIDNLVKNNRVSDETLFYDDLIETETFDEVREKYINQVGR